MTRKVLQVFGGKDNMSFWSLDIIMQQTLLPPFLPWDHVFSTIFSQCLYPPLVELHMEVTDIVYCPPPIIFQVNVLRCSYTCYQ